MESTLDVEKKEQQTQTEPIESQPIVATPKKKRQQTTATDSEKKAMNFKLTQDKAGQLKGITIKFAN